MYATGLGILAGADGAEFASSKQVVAAAMSHHHQRFAIRSHAWRKTPEAQQKVDPPGQR